MQAVKTHSASFAWSTRFKSIGGRDIVPSSFEVERALRNRKQCRSVYVSVCLSCALLFGFGHPGVSHCSAAISGVHSASHMHSCEHESVKYISYSVP